MYFPRRIILCLLMFTGLITNYMLRVNMSIAIVELVDTGHSSVQVCEDPAEFKNSTKDQREKEPVVDWSNFQVGWVLSAFFIGYASLQVPAGRLAEMYGTKAVFGWSMAGCGVLALITPVLLVTSAGFPIILIIRLLQGALESAAFPALNPATSKWVPENEKYNFVSFAYVGGTFGTIITYPMCGLILDKLGWEAVFYITGGITLAWFVIWMFLVSDLPEEHKSISKQELELIMSSRTYQTVQNKVEKDVPILQLIKDMLLNIPTLLLMACELANSWGLYTLVTEGPTFFKEVLNFDISENGLLSALPYLGRFTGAQIFGSIAGCLAARNILKPLNVQKLMAATEFIFPAIGLVGLSFITDQPYLCVAVMSIAYCFNGAAYSGHTAQGLMIAPNRSGTLMGLTNGFGAVAGIIVPIVKSGIVGTPSTCDELIYRWRIIFCIPAGIYAVVAILFMFLASGVVQEYDKKTYTRKFNALY